MTHFPALSLYLALGCFTGLWEGRSMNIFSLFPPSDKLGFITSAVYGISCVTFVPFPEQ